MIEKIKLEPQELEEEVQPQPKQEEETESPIQMAESISIAYGGHSGTTITVTSLKHSAFELSGLITWLQQNCIPKNNQTKREGTYYG